jgi:hypothetical protein
MKKMVAPLRMISAALSQPNLITKRVYLNRILGLSLGGRLRSVSILSKLPEVKPVGEQTEFKPGMRAPNNGTYIEIGENDFHMGITNPKQIQMKAGDKFPETTNKDRKWTRKGNE